MDEGNVTSLTLILRLASPSAGDQKQPDEQREIKVLQRTRVSHLLKTISPAFGGYIEKDIEAYLLLPDMDLALEPSLRLSDYNCKNFDVIELRRKEQPITLAVNIFADEVREYQVNASMPVYEIVKTIGKLIGVENTKELSLAFPSSIDKNEVSISHMNWLDVTKSLNAQGIEDGDMVLLRKKFFIFNEDVQEAEQNDLLKRMIYYQLQTQINRAQTKRKVSNAFSGLSSVGSDLESLDEDMVGSPGFFNSVMQAFEGPEITESPEEEEEEEEEEEMNNEDFMTTLSRHKSQLTTQFILIDCSDNCVNYMNCQSSMVCLSKDRKIDENTKITRKWPIKELNWEMSENMLKLGFDEDWCNYYSDQTLQIIEYLTHMKSIVVENEPTEEYPQIPPSHKIYTNNSLPSTPSSSPLKKSVTASTNSDDDKQSFPTTDVSPVNNENVIEVTTPEILIIDDESSTSGGPPNQSVTSSEAEEEAGIGITEEKGATGIDIQPIPIISPTSPTVLSPSHKPRNERRINIVPPSYFGKEHFELTDNYMLVHINVLDQEMRQIIIKPSDTVRIIIRDICATFDIQYPDEHYLRIPRTVEEIINNYGGKPAQNFGGRYGRRNSQKQLQIIFDENLSLLEQIDLNLKPYVFVLRRKGFDDTDAAERHSLDIGKEWPDSEDTDVARHRMFYQSWMAIVQGEYPISKKFAIKLAGLLTYIYYGKKSDAPYWPPPDLDVTRFLPIEFHNLTGVTQLVLKANKEYENISLNDAIDKVIMMCQDVPTYGGLYFKIKVPTNGILIKKMETRIIGLKRDGIVCFDKDIKKSCWKQSYTDISDWAIGTTSFCLKFNDDQMEYFRAFTYQSKQIMEMMQTYVKMHYKEASAQKELSPISISDV